MPSYRTQPGTKPSGSELSNSRTFSYFVLLVVVFISGRAEWNVVSGLSPTEYLISLYSTIRPCLFLIVF